MREKLRLYGILGCSGIPHPMIRMVESAIEGGMTMFQLREKNCRMTNCWRRPSPSINSAKNTESRSL
ncbi:MAG: hypothetical protein Q4A41_00215 [Bacillota bacterium]|nr:hypothetical protein [Bacillota bacterium]